MKWTHMALAAILAIAFASQIPWSRTVKGQNDFLQFYIGAQLAGTGKLHSSEAMRELQMEAAGVWLPAVAYFVRPDYYAVLLKPLNRLPFIQAYWLFQALNLMALASFLWCFRSDTSLIRLSFTSIPLIVCFANGQDVPLLIALLAFAVLLEERDRPFEAGLLLALCTIKFHFLIFVPFALLFSRRWKIIAGGLAGFSLLFAIAGISEGWDWLIRYPSYLRRPELHPEPFQFMNLRGIAKVFGWDLGLGIGVVVALALLWLLWHGREGKFRSLLALCLTGGVFLSFHLGIQDCSLLLLVVALAQPGSPLFKGAIVLSLPIAYWLLMMNDLIGMIPALALLVTLVWQCIKSYEELTIPSNPAALER